MEIPIRVNRDFGKTYPDASASATECAMNLARTGDLVLGRVASTLQPLDVSPAGGLVLGILKDAGQPCPPNYISERLIVSLSLIHISEPTRLGMISYAVFCLKKKK